MSNKAKTMQRALEMADAERKSPDGIEDIAMADGYTIGGQPAGFLSAAVIRIHGRVLNAAEERDGERPDATESGMLVLYLLLHAAPQKRAKLWRDARNPMRVWDAFVDWQFTLSPAINEVMSVDLDRILEDYSNAAKIEVGDESDENPTPSATGYPA